MRACLVIVAAAAIALSSTASASAATTEIGAVAEIDGNQAPDPLTKGGYAVQVGTGGGHSYAVPAGYGVITSWRHRTGTTTGPLEFKVYRPTGTPGEYTTIARDTETVTAGQTLRFDVRIPVQPGDLIGLGAAPAPGSVEEAYDAGASDVDGLFPSDADPGTTTSIFVAAPSYLLDVAATVETDADADGYGDDTQDQCPSDATKQTECIPPITSLDKKPRRVVKTSKSKAKVKFAFSSSEEGSTFQCQIDKKPFAPCTSPLKKKFKPGKHRFAVEAIDAAGNVDDSPSVAKFKVERK